MVGGGDTGSDCVGTSIRHGAISVTQLEILPKPPETSNDETPWPQWPRIMRTSSSQEEGCERRWSVLTKDLCGDDGQVRELFGIEVNWLPGAKGWEMKEIPGTEFVLPADLVLIAMGFLHVVQTGLLEELGVKIDNRGNVAVDNWMSTVPGVFAAGDTVRGPRSSSTQSIKVASWPPPSTSGCGSSHGPYPAIVLPPSTGRQTPVT